MLQTYWLGTRNYQPTFELMQKLVELRRKDEVGDRLLLLEHAPVITLGRGAKADHILAGREQLQSVGIEVVETGRGGDVTLHAPGQLIAYPIFKLEEKKQDVRKYVNHLTDVMNALVENYSIAGGKKDGLIGLWVDRDQPHEWPGEEAASSAAKIGAIGVRLNRWVSSHGFALNFNTDLSLYNLIVPCGISDFGVTSVKQLRGAEADLKERAAIAARLLPQMTTDELVAPLEDLENKTDAEILSIVLKDRVP